MRVVRRTPGSASGRIPTDHFCQWQAARARSACESSRRALSGGFGGLADFLLRNRSRLLRLRPRPKETSRGRSRTSLPSQTGCHLSLPFARLPHRVESSRGSCPHQCRHTPTNASGAHRPRRRRRPAQPLGFRLDRSGTRPNRRQNLLAPHPDTPWVAVKRSIIFGSRSLIIMEAGFPPPSTATVGLGIRVPY